MRTTKSWEKEIKTNHQPTKTKCMTWEKPPYKNATQKRKKRKKNATSSAEDMNKHTQRTPAQYTISNKKTRTCQKGNEAQEENMGRNTQAINPPHPRPSATKEPRFKGREPKNRRST